jgi:Bacterial SH3 domain
MVAAKVNLRSGPGTESEVVATIPAGSRVQVGECNGEWCAVRWNGHEGYAIARNLTSGASRQAGAYPPPGGQGQPGYPGDGYDYPPGAYYGPGYAYGPPVVYGPAYYYGPRIYYGRGWGWRRRW